MSANSRFRQQQKRETAFTCVKTAYREYLGLLSPRRMLSAEVLEDFYNKCIAGPLAADPILEASVFDAGIFPSLYDVLPVHPRTDLSAIDARRLTRWPPTALSDDFARLLLAFVWKQGDLDKVKHVIKGLNQVLPESGVGNAAVMWQFGRHLSDPFNEPIFDQHTARFLLVSEKIGDCRNYSAFAALFGQKKPQIRISAATLTKEEMRHRYVAWWKDKVALILPPPNSGDLVQRGKGILWSDRIMFSLGKAAELLRKDPSKKTANNAPPKTGRHDDDDVSPPI